MKAIATLALAAAALVAGPARADSVHTDGDSFFYAAAARGVTEFREDSFEELVGQTETSLQFDGFSFGCSGTAYCPGFFGRSTEHGVTDGQYSVYFASPDVATFTFDTAINAFAVSVSGLGDVGSTSLVITYASGVQTLFEGLDTDGAFGTLFAGLVTDEAITAISFTGLADGDGIFFDYAIFGTGANPTPAVPEPASWATMIAGFGLVGTAMRRRVRRRVQAV
jgi:hypothetical protein